MEWTICKNIIHYNFIFYFQIFLSNGWIVSKFRKCQFRKLFQSEMSIFVSFKFLFCDDRIFFVRKRIDGIRRKRKFIVLFINIYLFILFWIFLRSHFLNSFCYLFLAENSISIREIFLKIYLISWIKVKTEIFRSVSRSNGRTKDWKFIIFKTRLILIYSASIEFDPC